MKKVVVNADDFGITEAVTLGILSGHREGMITSASMMVNMLYAEQAGKLAKEFPDLGLGVHLNVTVGKPVSAPETIPSLVTENGTFHSVKDYMQNKVEIDEEDLLKEILAQIELFIKYTGLKPDHINHHHMYDFFGAFPRVTEHLIQKYHVPMRLMRSHPRYPFPMAAPDHIFFKENLTEEEFCNHLRNNLKDDLVELGNHAGFVDYDIMKISSLNIARANDLHLCKSKKAKKIINELGYRLVKWSEI